MLHFVTSYMKQNKSRKQTLESAQYGLQISFKNIKFPRGNCQTDSFETLTLFCLLSTIPSKT